MDKPKLELVETCDHYGCDKPAKAPHACPFKQEINDDETLCTCCADCEHECMMEI